MEIQKCENEKIFVEIPLTTQSGKIRVKVRDSFYEYGLPTAPKQVPFSQKHYIEWQIGYDVDKSDKEKLALSTLQHTKFIGANGKTKALYELSEYLYYFTQWGIIEKDEILRLNNFLKNIEETDFIDQKFKISTEDAGYFKVVMGNVFTSRVIKQPHLIAQHPPYSKERFLIEIIIKEKQRAVGVQPMLYVCFPVTNLVCKSMLLNREAKSKECGLLILDSKDKEFLLETFKIFGILSKNHNTDVCEILKIVINIL